MSVINVLDLSSFQSLVGNDKPTSMCDLLAAVRLLETNISYVDKVAASDCPPSRKALYENVKNHLNGDLQFIEDGIRRQVSLRQEQDAKIQNDKEKALADEDFKLPGTPQERLQAAIAQKKADRTSK